MPVIMLDRFWLRVVADALKLAVSCELIGIEDGFKCVWGIG